MDILAFKENEEFFRTMREGIIAKPYFTSPSAMAK